MGPPIQEPNFADKTYADARQVLTQAGVSQDQAISILKNVWRVQQRQQEQQQQQVREQQASEESPPEARKPKLPPFQRGVPPPTLVPIRPSEYAISRLRKYKFVELWYFTREGCHDAACSMSTAIKASAAAIPDAHLTCDQISLASYVFVRTLEELNWPEDYINAFTDFFSHLKDERTKSLHPDTDQAIVEYQATTRREWFNALCTPRQFDIGEFSQERFHNIRLSITLRNHDLVNDNPYHHSTSNPTRRTPTNGTNRSHSVHSPSPCDSRGLPTRRYRSRSPPRTWRNTTETARINSTRLLTACALCLSEQPHSIQECNY